MLANVKKLTVQIEDELHQRLRVVCARRDVSQQWVVTGLIHSWVTRQEAEQAEEERHERVRPGSE